MEPVITTIALGAGQQFLKLFPYIALGIVLTAAFTAFLPDVNIKHWFTRAGSLPVIGATIAGVATPL